MSEGELSRIAKVRPLPGDTQIIEANAGERAALSKRFDLAGIESLVATIELEERAQSIRAEGRLDAQITQICAISAEEFPVRISEPLDLKFVPSGSLAVTGNEDDEIELEADDCDEIEYSGDTLDIGEAVAQTLGLAIDPYAEGPNADAARKAAGIIAEGEQDGPLAEALKSLKQG